MSKERVLSYDLFRGILFIGMLIFHVLVNLTPLQFNQELFYFVPMGFVMFLGVVLGRFLVGRTCKKLILGLKLLAIFLVMNIPNFINKEFSFLTFLRGDQAVFSFEILFPMVLLIFATIFLDKFVMIRRVALVLLFVGLVVLKYFGFFSYNLSFFIYGLIGYFLALNFDLNLWLTKFKNWKYVLLVIFISVVPFLMVQYLGLYDFVLIFQILAIYFLSSLALKNNRALIWTGKNSLWLYVGHIIVIKLTGMLVNPFLFELILR